MKYKTFLSGQFLTFSAILLLNIFLANAYIDTLDDCVRVADKFQSTCNQQTTAVDWNFFPAQSLQCQNVGVCPDGSNNIFCNWQRKLCVTCTTENNIVFIRVQSNGLPSHCFNTSLQLSPTQIDFKVRFNYIPGDTDELVTKTFIDQTNLDAQLCFPNKANFDKIPQALGFVNNQVGNNSLENIVGVSITGAPLFTAASIYNVDPFYPNQWTGYKAPPTQNTGTNSSVQVQQVLSPENVDRCLGGAYNNDNIYHYQIMSPCWLDTSIPAGQCSTDVQCKKNFKDYMLTTFNNNKTLKVIGLAKDGRVIYGPYKQDATLWGCGDFDQCNGRVMEDGSYAYLSTQTFPYFVGCWGPGPQRTITPSCSLNSCDFGLKKIKEIGILGILVLISFLSLF